MLVEAALFPWLRYGFSLLEGSAESPHFPWMLAVSIYDSYKTQWNGLYYISFQMNWGPACLIEKPCMKIGDRRLQTNYDKAIEEKTGNN